VTRGMHLARGVSPALVRNAQNGWGQAHNRNGSIGNGMWEGDPVGMQMVSDIPGHRDTSALGNWQRCTARCVERIVDQRVAGRCEVDADLVRSAGDDLDLDNGSVLVRVAMQDTALRTRRLAGRVCGVHVLDLGVRDAADRRIDGEAVGEIRATGKREVDLGQAAV
jgi:hypothetical protein